MGALNLGMHEGRWITGGSAPEEVVELIGTIEPDAAVATRKAEWY